MYRNERSARSRNRKAFPGIGKNRDREAIDKRPEEAPIGLKINSRGARLVKERDLQRAVLDYFALQKDCFAIRVNTQGAPLHGRDGFRPSPMKGIADILVCIKGRFLAIELKSDKGKGSLEQQAFLDSVNKTGGFAIVASSLDAVMDIVEQIKKTQYLGVQEYAD